MGECKGISTIRQNSPNSIMLYRIASVNLLCFLYVIILLVLPSWASAACQEPLTFVNHQLRLHLLRSSINPAVMTISPSRLTHLSSTINTNIVKIEDYLSRNNLPPLSLESLPSQSLEVEDFTGAHDAVLEAVSELEALVGGPAAVLHRLSRSAAGASLPDMSHVLIDTL